MPLKQALLLVVTATLAAGQRPPFAGTRPIGYPEIITTTAAAVTDDLGNRFGEDNNTAASTAPTTTQRLPIEAYGDRDLVDRLSKLPIDKQPFWFINWQAYEANRNKPQTYPIRPSSFAQPISPGLSNNFNTGGNQDLDNRNQPNGPTTSNPNVNNGFNSNVNPAGNNINGGNVDDTLTSLGNRNGEFGVTNTAKPEPLVQPISPVKVDADEVTNQVSLGNRNGDVVSTGKPQQFLQQPVNTAGFPSNHGSSQVSDNSFGNRFGSENSGLPTASFNPSLSTQQSRPIYPSGQYYGGYVGGNRYPGPQYFGSNAGLNGYPVGQYFGNNVGGNRYPGPQYFGSNAGPNGYPKGQYFGSNFGGNRYTNVGPYYGLDESSYFGGGAPYPLWSNEYPQPYYGNQFEYNGPNLGSFRRSFEDYE